MIGLYRDDGLAAVRSISARNPDRLHKDITAVFKSLGLRLRVTIQGNLTAVDFLDVTFHLPTGRFSAYRKPNDTPSTCTVTLATSRSAIPQCRICSRLFGVTTTKSRKRIAMTSSRQRSSHATVAASQNAPCTGSASIAALFNAPM
eukprot:scpid105002/ scgid26096/ 